MRAVRPNRKPTAAISKVGSRMRLAPRALLAGGLGFAVSFLVACGGGKGLLSGGDASNINSQLDSVSSAVAARQCGGAVSALSALNNSVANLPSSVSPPLRANLMQGVSTVSALSQRDCTSTTQPTTTTTTTPTTTTPTSAPSTTPSTPTSTPSRPPSTSTPTSTPTTTTPPSGGGGLGNGGGGGNGNGNGHGNGNGGGQ